MAAGPEAAERGPGQPRRTGTMRLWTRPSALLRAPHKRLNYLTEAAFGLTPRPDRYRNPPSPAARQRTSAANMLPKKDRLPVPSLKVGSANSYLKSPILKSLKPWPRSARSSSCRKCAPRPTRSLADAHARPLITTIMVFVMVAVASIFFLVADQVIRIVITFVLGIAG